MENYRDAAEPAARFGAHAPDPISICAYRASRVQDYPTILRKLVKPHGEWKLKTCRCRGKLTLPCIPGLAVPVLA